VPEARILKGVDNVRIGAPHSVLATWAADDDASGFDWRSSFELEHGTSHLIFLLGGRQ